MGYRFWTVRNANQLGLFGYVRNADRGKVEAVFEGEEEKVKSMIKECSKGPEVAWVENVEVKWEEVTDEFNNFEVRY